MGKAYSGIFHLPLTGFTAKLCHDLTNLCKTCGSQRVSTAEQAAGCIYRGLSTQLGIPFHDKSAPFTLRTQPKRFIMHDLRNGEGIVAFNNIKVPRSQTGLVIGKPAGPVVSFPSYNVLGIFIISGAENGCTNLDGSSDIFCSRGRTDDCGGGPIRSSTTGRRSGGVAA